MKFKHPKVVENLDVLSDLASNLCNEIDNIKNMTEYELEKIIEIPTDNYQKRIFGFLSERLFNLYILHNKFKIKEYPLLFITD